MSDFEECPQSAHSEEALGEVRCALLQLLQLTLVCLP